MCFVHKQPINAQFFKSNNIILSALTIELVEFQFNSPAALFNLLDGKPFSICSFRFGYAINDFVELFFKNSPLSFYADWYLLKLRVSDNDCIIIAGGNP